MANGNRGLIFTLILCAALTLLSGVLLAQTVEAAPLALPPRPSSKGWRNDLSARLLQHRVALEQHPLAGAVDDRAVAGWAGILARRRRLAGGLCWLFMGKSQKTSHRFAVGNRIAVGVNGKAGDLGAAAPAQAKLAQASSLKKPRRFAPGSFTSSADVTCKKFDELAK